MAFLKRLASFLLVLAVVAPAWISFRWQQRADLAPYRAYAPPSPGPSRSGVTARFFGVSTLAFEDGETTILVDGFFSRPGPLSSLFGRIAPDRERVAGALERAGIERAAAVIVVHSHYDHVMDAPLVAELTGAELVGSESTANVARGWPLPEERIRIVEAGAVLRFGRFAVTLLPTLHFPHGMAMGEIGAPLTPPARASDYKEGGSYSLLIEHEGRTLLVQGSAGFLPGALRGRSAETVFLGLAGLGTRDDDYRQDYWREVVGAVAPRRVVPIHWDDFTRPLDEPLVSLPGLLDDVGVSMDFVIERARAAGIEPVFLEAWREIDPFAGS